MTLKDKLGEQERKLPPAARAAYEDLVHRLGTAETAARALKLGEAMPDFVLPDAEGKLVASEELRAQGPLIVSFFRGEWCPFCRLMLAALNEAAPSIKEMGARLVAISPETGGRLRRTKKRLGLALDLLSDVDNGVALGFGVAFRAPEAYHKLLEGFGTDLTQRHGNQGWIIPIPATFVVDRAGVVRYAFVEPGFAQRAEPDAIIAAVKAITQDRSA